MCVGVVFGCRKLMKRLFDDCLILSIWSYPTYSNYKIISKIQFREIYFSILLNDRKPTQYNKCYVSSFIFFAYIVILIHIPKKNVILFTIIRIHTCHQSLQFPRLWFWQILFHLIGMWLIYFQKNMLINSKKSTYYLIVHTNTHNLPEKRTAVRKKSHFHEKK